MLESNLEFNDRDSDRVTRLMSLIDIESTSEKDNDSEMICMSSFLVVS
nr:hypothetical protein [Nitrosopumilus oxyclinae]